MLEWQPCAVLPEPESHLQQQQAPDGLVVLAKGTGTANCNVVLQGGILVSALVQLHTPSVGKCRKQ